MTVFVVLYFVSQVVFASAAEPFNLGFAAPSDRSRFRLPRFGAAVVPDFSTDAVLEAARQRARSCPAALKADELNESGCRERGDQPNKRHSEGRQQPPNPPPSPEEGSGLTLRVTDLRTVLAKVESVKNKPLRLLRKVYSTAPEQHQGRPDSRGFFSPFPLARQLYRAHVRDARIRQSSEPPSETPDMFPISESGGEQGVGPEPNAEVGDEERHVQFVGGETVSFVVGEPHAKAPVAEDPTVQTRSQVSGSAPGYSSEEPSGAAHPDNEEEPHREDSEEDPAEDMTLSRTSTIRDFDAHDLSLTFGDLESDEESDEATPNEAGGFSASASPGMQQSNGVAAEHQNFGRDQEFYSSPEEPRVASGVPFLWDPECNRAGYFVPLGNSEGPLEEPLHPSSSSGDMLLPAQPDSLLRGPAAFPDAEEDMDEVAGEELSTGGLRQRRGPAQEVPQSGVTFAPELRNEFHVALSLQKALVFFSRAFSWRTGGHSDVENVVVEGPEAVENLTYEGATRILDAACLQCGSNFMKQVCEDGGVVLAEAAGHEQHELEEAMRQFCGDWSSRWRLEICENLSGGDDAEAIEAQAEQDARREPPTAPSAKNFRHKCVTILARILACVANNVSRCCPTRQIHEVRIEAREASEHAGDTEPCLEWAGRTESKRCGRRKERAEPWFRVSGNIRNLWMGTSHLEEDPFIREVRKLNTNRENHNDNENVGTTSILPQQTDLSGGGLEKERYSLEFFTSFAVPLHGRVSGRGRMVVQYEESPEHNRSARNEKKVMEAQVVVFVPELWRGGTVLVRKVDMDPETLDSERGELELSESSVRGVPASFSPQLLGRRSQAVGAEMSEPEEPDNAQHEEA